MGVEHLRVRDLTFLPPCPSFSDFAERIIVSFNLEKVMVLSEHRTVKLVLP